jgi:hypothetical protein
VRGSVPDSRLCPNLQWIPQVIPLTIEEASAFGANVGIQAVYLTERMVLATEARICCKLGIASSDNKLRYPSTSDSDFFPGLLV